MQHPRTAARTPRWPVVALALIALAGVALMAVGLANAQGGMFLGGLVLMLAGGVPGLLRVSGLGRR